jgi:hypothetical protein
LAGGHLLRLGGAVCALALMELQQTLGRGNLLCPQMGGCGNLIFDKTKKQFWKSYSTWFAMFFFF